MSNEEQVSRELDDDLVGDLDPDTPPADLNDAVRYGLAYRRALHDIALVVELVEERIEQLNDWRDRRIHEPSERMQRIRAALDSFARHAVTEMRTKTVHVPVAGLRLRLSAPTPRLDVTDPEAFVEWHETVWRETPFGQQLSLVDWRPTVTKASVSHALRSGNLRTGPSSERPNGDLEFPLVDASGEVVPGIVEVREGRDTFSISLTDSPEPKENDND